MKKRFFIGLAKLIGSLAVIAAILILLFSMRESKSLAYFFNSKSNVESNTVIENGDADFYIYCSDVNKTSIYKFGYAVKSSDLNDSVKELLDELKKVPETRSLVSPIPQNVSVLNFSYGEDGQLILDFDENYYEMSSLDEVICRSSIVKTICQLKDINDIEFFVGGFPLMLNEEVPVGLMNSLDFVDNTGAISDFDEQYFLKVYFTDESGNMLQISQLKVESILSKTPEELVLSQLLSGPLESQENLKPVIPADTVVNKVKTIDGTCYVDFNEHFIDGIEGVKKDVIVYSVVNSLCELKGISKVKITINGSDDVIFGNNDFSEFLLMKPGLIADEKAGGK